MRRGIGIVLLSLGTVIGFGWGFARLAGYCPHGYGCDGPGFHGHGAWGEGRQHFEDRAADACVRAAERVLAERHATPTPGAAPPPGGATPTPTTSTPAP